MQGRSFVDKTKINLQHIHAAVLMQYRLRERFQRLASASGGNRSVCRPRRAPRAPALDDRRRAARVREGVMHELIFLRRYDGDGKPTVSAFSIQLDEARAEWRRRNPKNARI